ncbi:MAG TPA: hypothetical protein VKT80_06135, partial [Chloroflexota bacterium]|nr:hypothetical protein [Chloroflexota bacterium]
DQARQQGMSQLASQKDRIAGTLGNVADALHATSSHLKQNDDIPIAGYVDQIASSVEQFSNHVRQQSVDELIGETESLARRRPGLFIGGAFIVGLVAARFLKISRQDPAMLPNYPAPYPGMARSNSIVGSPSWQKPGPRSPTVGSSYPYASPATGELNPSTPATSETPWRG